MKKFTGIIKTDVSCSECEFSFFIDEGATPEEIEEAARLAAFEYVEWYFEEKDERQ